MNTITKAPAIAIEFRSGSEEAESFYTHSLLLASSEIDIYKESFLTDPDLSRKTIYLGHEEESLETLIPEFDFSQTFDFLWWNDEEKTCRQGCSHFIISKLMRVMARTFFDNINKNTAISFERCDEYDYTSECQQPAKMRLHRTRIQDKSPSFYLTSSTSNHSIVYGGVTFYSLHTLTKFLDIIGIKWKKEKVSQVRNCGNCLEASSTIVHTSVGKKVRCMHPMAYSHETQQGPLVELTECCALYTPIRE